MKRGSAVAGSEGTGTASPGQRRRPVGEEVAEPLEVAVRPSFEGEGGLLE
jgi:hypothetical protein